MNIPSPFSIFSRMHFFSSKSSSPSFQIASDLHLEVGQQYSFFKIPPTAPYLILAGDIGRLIEYDSYLAFLASQTAQFELVFLVLGNHEFYGLSIAAGIKQAQKLEQEAILSRKLVLLHQKRFNVPNSTTTILGCTLWSNIPDNAREVVQTKVKDFQKSGIRVISNQRGYVLPQKLGDHTTNIAERSIFDITKVVHV